jgi:general secretion pathway protein M
MSQSSEQAPNQLLATLKDTFNEFWDARQERERQILQLGAAVFALILLYYIAIEPALTGRDDLRKSLPLLHQQSAELKQMAQELAGIPNPDNRHEITRELVETEFNSNGMKPTTLSVNDGVVRAQFNSTTMAALQTVLLDLQKSSGLFVEDIKITGLDAGMISASFTLRQPIASES